MPPRDQPERDRPDKNRLVGIVTLGDLAVETFDEELSGEVLAEVSAPSEPER
ncbi:MAG: hypothetical protein KY468_02110 [Armatimonadetes bacterium]|nr:hypothetical protein [Armatimonadota bacterium]